MSTKLCQSVMENCQNLYDSFGTICVGCNCCGRIDPNTMWECRYQLSVRRLQDLIEDLLGEYFQSNLQQENICTSISYWAEQLKEILSHVDFEALEAFDAKKGVSVEQKRIEDLTAFLLEKSNAANVEPVFVTNDGIEITLDDKSSSVLNSVLEQAFIPYLAKVLCEEGYSKEKKGAWVKTCVPDIFQCTNCKHPTKMDMLCDSEVLRAYCPNCGAKMTYPTEQ